MSRTVQSDQVIDDDEAESCPLCIEELDLSDRNFFPCPCGYQVRSMLKFHYVLRFEADIPIRYVSSVTITSRPQ